MGLRDLIKRKMPATFNAAEYETGRVLDRLDEQAQRQKQLEELISAQARRLDEADHQAKAILDKIEEFEKVFSGGIFLGGEINRDDPEFWAKMTRLNQSLRGKGLAVAMFLTAMDIDLDPIIYEYRPDLIRSGTLALLAREIKRRSVLGAVAELGVAYGEFASVINALFPERMLYLFDTFSGFDDADLEHDRSAGFTDITNGTYSDTNVDIVMKKMRHPERCIIRKGYFPDTAQGLEETFAFVNIDCDLYLPIKAGLEYFYPRMASGGVIFVHDYLCRGYEGVHKALCEFADQNGVFFTVLPDDTGTAILIKPQ